MKNKFIKKGILVLILLLSIFVNRKVYAMTESDESKCIDIKSQLGIDKVSRCMRFSIQDTNNNTYYIELGVYIDSENASSLYPEEGSDDIYEMLSQYLAVSDNFYFNDYGFNYHDVKKSGSENTKLTVSIDDDNSFTVDAHPDYKIFPYAGGEAASFNPNFVDINDLQICINSGTGNVYIGGATGFPAAAGCDSGSQGYYDPSSGMITLPVPFYQDPTDPSGGGSIGGGPIGGGTTPSTPQISAINFCGRKGVLQAFKIVGYVLFVAKIVVPLLLIIMGITDLAKAVISNDDKANKVALSALIRRSIIAVVIFLIPGILNYLFLLIDGTDDLVNGPAGFSDCTTCLLDPGNCQNAELEQVENK